jgi:hypothetical protein
MSPGHVVLRAATAVLVLFLAPALRAGEFRGVRVGVRAGFDVGSLSVPGTDHGIGGGVGLRAAFGDERAAWELGAELDVAGYVGAGDGDPLFLLAATIARRAGLGDGPGFWRAGLGAGIFGVGADAAALPVSVGLGLDLAPRAGVGVELMAYDRFTLAFTGGDPGVDYVNSLGIELSVRFARPR